MLKSLLGAFVVLVSLSACTAPKLGGNPESVRIAPPPPGKAVIYLVRSVRDWSTNASLVFHGDQWLGTTAAGVYYRMEVEPGRHRLSGYAFDQGNITIDAKAGEVYFVEHHVMGMYNRAQVMHSSEFRMVTDERAREVIANIHTMPDRLPEGSVTVLPAIPDQ
jgi:hypothetical protein